MNITGLDHVVLLCRDILQATSTYSVLLGRTPDWQHTHEEDGTATTLFILENMAVELLAPNGNGPVGERIVELLEGREGMLSSIAFRTDDINEAHYQATIRELFPGHIDHMQASYRGRTRQWSRFRCDDTALSGLKVFLMAEKQPLTCALSEGDGAAFRMDHIVVNTGNPDRALEAYGTKLGLRLALDRTHEKWGARFLFFRLPDVTIEVINRIDTSMTPDEPDQLWGLTWQVDNLDAAHDRLVAQGVGVSAVRDGRKPGTRVMSIKSHDLGVPTLFLEAGSNRKPVSSENAGIQTDPESSGEA